MFKTRLLSGIVLVAVALLTIISGGYVLFFTLLGISLIGMQELYKVMKVREDHFNALEIAGYFGAVIYYVLMSLDFEKYWNDGRDHCVHDRLCSFTYLLIPSSMQNR